LNKKKKEILDLVVDVKYDDLTTDDKIFYLENNKKKRQEVIDGILNNPDKDIDNLTLNWKRGRRDDKNAKVGEDIMGEAYEENDPYNPKGWNPDLYRYLLILTNNNLSSIQSEKDFKEIFHESFKLLIPETACEKIKFLGVITGIDAGNYSNTMGHGKKGDLRFVQKDGGYIIKSNSNNYKGITLSLKGIYQTKAIAPHMTPGMSVYSKLERFYDKDIEQYTYLVMRLVTSMKRPIEDIYFDKFNKISEDGIKEIPLTYWSIHEKLGRVVIGPKTERNLKILKKKLHMDQKKIMNMNLMMRVMIKHY